MGDEPDDALTYDVVVPTRGRRPALLQAALDSIDRQTLPPANVVVVVDGGTHVADEVRQRHPRATTVCLDRTRGEAVARQRGIDACTSPWVAFLDDDDLWSPCKQAVTAAYLSAHPSCRAVRSGYWMFAAPDDPVGGLNGQLVEVRGETLDDLEAAASSARPRNDLSYLDIEGASLDLMLEFNRGVIGTTMVRRDLLDAIPRVPEGQRPGADYLLFCHVAARAEWHLVEERLAYYRVHGGQDTQANDSSFARGIVGAKVEAWRVDGSHASRPLSSYGPLYRAELRGLLWDTARSGRPGQLHALWRTARPILPRARDRALALVPQPLVWRLTQAALRLRGGKGEPDGPAW